MVAILLALINLSYLQLLSLPHPYMLLGICLNHGVELEVLGHPECPQR